MKKQQRITLLTLGCSKNLVDSENLLGKLKSQNFAISYDAGNTDILLINTCGFIKPAKEESLGVILDACELKHKKKLKKIVVFGCLAERYKDELESKIKDVDFFCGLNQDEAIINYITKGTHQEIIESREILTPSHYAYIKISEGCNHQCSFCAIPLIRGPYISKPIEKIISEVETLVSKGVKEINFIAQDTTYYGIDLYGKSKIAELMDKAASVNGVRWLRLMYTYPSNFPYDLLDVMLKHPNICRYIDIPLQHISDDVLQSMKRGMGSRKTIELIDNIRTKIPDITIRSTFITGYPNETEKDFNELHEFIKTAKLDRVGVFTYSHEENTPAFVLNDSVPEEVKIERQNILMETQSKISLEKNKQLVGREFEVLIDEKKSKNEYIGRTKHDAPDVDNSVIIKSDVELSAGEFVNVRINNATEYDLYADYLNKNL